MISGLYNQMQIDLYPTVQERFCYQSVLSRCDCGGNGGDFVDVDVDFGGGSDGGRGSAFHRFFFTMSDKR